MSAHNTNNAYFRAAAITHGITYVLLLSSQSYVTAQDNNINSAPPPNPYGFNTNFNPSMAIIIVVLMSAFFFMGFFSIYIRQCAGDRTDVSTRPTAAGRSQRAARGLDPAIIDTFPTFIYSVVKGLKLGKGTLECAVCLNEFEDDETLRLLPKCDHVFHPECIDAWLVSHVTCPVCRANLKPDAASDDQVTDVGHRIADVGSADSDSERESENLHHHDSGSIRRRTDVESTHNQISIAICDEDSHQQQQQQQPQLINPNLIPFQNRPVRSKSSARGRIASKFPRSHSTGHSLVQPGENCDRYTLRLPEEIRKQIMLKRTTSCVNFPAGDGSFSRRSSRRGYRGSGRGGESEGSSRGKYYQFWRLDQRAKSDRWVFSMAPPFFSRTSSMKSPKGANGEGSVNSRNFLTSVKTPFDCLGAKVDGGGQSVSRPPV